jgi:hypothetical protein
MGTVTFFIDGVAQASPPTLSTVAPYTATFNYGFPVSGTHYVSAAYTSGNSTYTGSVSPSVTITVAAQGTAPTTTAVTISPTSFLLGSIVTLSATVTATTASMLTGPLTFSTGGTKIATFDITAGTGNTATSTFYPNATASLGFVDGTDTITATYGGDAYNATSSGTTTAAVSDHPAITLSATNVTITSPSPGNSGTSNITVNSIGGYQGTVTVSASAGSLNANYGFDDESLKTISLQLSPTCIPIAYGPCFNQASQGVVLTITTMATIGNLETGRVGNSRKTVGRIAAAEGTAAGCILSLLIPGIRRKRWTVALAMLGFLSAVADPGCGVGGPAGASPAGVYTVTVTAVDSNNANMTGSTTFTVTIQ